MAGKQNNNQHKEADFGYFGKGIDGYVHYKQAFDRNFSEDNSYKKDDSANYHHRSQSNAAQKSKGSTCASNKHFEPAQTINGRTYKPIMRTNADVDKTKRLKDENPYNHPRQGVENDAPTQLDRSMAPSDSFYYPPAQKPHSQYNPPSKGESNKDSSRSSFCTIILFILIWMGAMSLITGIPYLLGFLLTGSAGGADSFGGIFILVVGVILIFFL